jgi:excisionase family DNA binding protein
MTAITVREFCETHRISRSTFYNLIRTGRGPRVMKIGEKTMVSQEALQDWYRASEAEAPERMAASAEKLKQKLAGSSVRGGATR